MLSRLRLHSPASILLSLLCLANSAAFLSPAQAETSSRFSFAVAQRAYKLSPPPPAEVLPGKWTVVAYAYEGRADGVHSPSGKLVSDHGKEFSQHVDFKPVEDALGNNGFEVAEYSLLWKTEKLEWDPPKTMGYLTHRELSWPTARCRWVEVKSFLLCGSLEDASNTQFASFIAYQKLPSKK